jgi:signal transduction histidine kinase
VQSFLKTWRQHPLWSRRTAVGVLVALVGLAVASVLMPGMRDITGPAGLFAGSISAGITFIVEARHLEHRERLAWTLVGVGLVVIGAGIATVAAVTAVASLPAFGPPDLLFLSGYALWVAGFALLPQVAGDWSQRLRVAFDGLIGAVSVGIVVWLLVLGDLFTKMRTLGAWDRWAGFAYPVLDTAALVTLIVVVLRRSAYRFDLRLFLVGLAFIAQAVADVVYLTSGIGHTFEEARPVYPLTIAALILLFLTALMVSAQPERREYPDRRASLLALATPYGVAALMTGMLIVRVARRSLDTGFWALLWGTIAVGGLVLIRQGIAIRENRILVERQRAALVSSISHELRTPLTAIVGFLDVIANGGVAAGEREELVRIVHQQATYMARIVSDLVLLARGTLDNIDLHPVRTTMSTFLRGALASVERTAAVVTVELDGVQSVFIDVERMQQLVINLASNATRYGGGRVEVVAKNVDSALVLEVHDDGQGVPKRYEYSIWDRFERGAHRLDATRPGSGIGLAVVRAVAKAHGGTAHYRRSERLGGSCFFVNLPGRVVDETELRAASIDS